MRGLGTRAATVLLLVTAACHPSSSPEPSPSPSAAASPSPEPPGADLPATDTESEGSEAVEAPHRVRDLRITVLSTTKAPRGVGEWGFSALVQADGQAILFDTGARRDTVLRNAQTLGIDLGSIPTVVLSHHHDDHVGGLLTLRRVASERDPGALGTVHVARGIFEPRRVGTGGREVNDLRRRRDDLESTGLRFVVHDQPTQIAPGVWVTGPVPRVHDERNFGGSRRIPAGEGWTEDTLPESQSLVIDTDEGLVVLSGCGHAGIINTITHARATIREAPIHAAMGGFHLHKASADHLQWTGEQLEAAGLERFLGAHCTGRRAVERFRTLARMTPQRSIELGVGESFELTPTD